jgi:hypothetical protein
MGELGPFQVTAGEILICVMLMARPNCVPHNEFRVRVVRRTDKYLTDEARHRIGKIREPVSR